MYIWLLKVASLRKAKAKNIKKKPTDSFSGIPAIVLDKNTGIKIINIVETAAIIFALRCSPFLMNISLTKKKKPCPNKVDSWRDGTLCHIHDPNGTFKQQVKEKREFYQKQRQH